MSSIERKCVYYLKQYQSRLFTDMMEYDEHMQVYFQDKIREINSILLEICEHEWIEDEIEICPDETIKKVRICSYCEVPLEIEASEE